MISEESLPALGANEEISALIKTLLATERRLEELTAGEVDPTTGRDGRMFLLRRAQEQLRDSEASKQASTLDDPRVLFDVVPAMIWFKDTENRFLRVNQRGAEKTGMSVEEMEGKSAYELFPQEADGYYADDLEVIRSGAPKKGIVEKLRGLNAEELWVQTDKVPVFDKDGRVTGIVVLTQDITERKRDEDALRESEQRFRRLAEATSEVFWILNPLKNQVVYVSPAFEKIWGRTCQSLYQNAFSFPDTIHPADQLKKRVSQDRLLSGEATDEEYRIVRPDGSIRWIWDRAYPIRNDSGDIYLVTGIASDITDRKQVDAALLQSESRYHSLFENMLEGYAYCQTVFEQDQLRDFIYLEVNSAFIKLTGLKNVVGKRVSEVIPGIRESNPELFEIYSRVVLTGKAEKFETNVEALGIWLSITVYSPQRTHFVAVFDNITTRKLADERLETSKQRLRDLIDGVGPSIFVGLLTPQGILIECNRSSLAAAGLTSEDVQGKPFDETPWWSHSPEAQQQLRETIARAARGEASRYDVRLQLAGDQHIDIDFSLQPLRDDAGEVVFLVPSACVITERKLAETALREVELRLAHAMSMAQLVAWEYDPATGLFNFSDRYYVLHGTTAELEGGNQMSAQDFTRRFVHPDDIHFVGDELGKAVAAADPDYRTQLECRIFRRDGELRHVLVSISITTDAAGRTIQIHGANQDITERKRTEEALRVSEAEFRALAEAMPQMVWIMRPDGWNIYFSQQWMDYTGLTLEESLGHGWTDAFHPDERQSAWDTWQLAMATAGVYSIEARLRSADGAYRWWLIRGVPQLEVSGNILKWFGTCTDIHDLKLAELEISRTNRALRQTDEKFHQLADNITDVFWIISPDFNTIHYVSAGYELIWGRSAESLYANPHQWIETILPEERESVFALFATLMGPTSKLSVEYRIARPDGTVRWIHDRGFQVRDAAGKLVRLTGIASDITERKDLETQLRQAQKLEAIGTLAGGIAHDFNNILAAIIGYSELAQKGISKESRAQGHLEQILIASSCARDLVQQILTFSRLEQPEREMLELQPIIDETLKLLQVSLPATVEIRQSIDTAAPPVLGDATQIQQLIMNLCMNAGQAMKENGGVLDISLSCLYIDARLVSSHPGLKEGLHICLAVSDTGCGIKRDTQERIFEPFFTTKAPGEGTGLGLAVVHGVVKNHRGVITVHSKLDVGTTFKVYLPVYDGQAVSLRHKSNPGQQGNGEDVVFVDDEQ